MITNQIIQQTLDSLNDITKIDFALYDAEGFVVAKTGAEKEVSSDFIRSFAVSDADSEAIGSNFLLKVYDEGDVAYILIAKGSMSEVATYSKILAKELQALITAYKDRLDKNNYFQNLILDNLLLVDIYNRAKKLHININVPRVVFVIESEGSHDNVSKEVLKPMFSEQRGDYITAVDEKNIILIKQLTEKDSADSILEIADSIMGLMNTEAMMKVKIAFGTVVKELKDVSKSYKEAVMALDVGKIFYPEKDIVSYSSLGIGRLIYQLPDNLCHIFIDEIFKDSTPFDIGEETLATVNKFFENNLNVSETSRQLYVHRNTLVYRLEKLKAATGLDVKTFDDALTFKIAMMVVEYLKHREENT